MNPSIYKSNQVLPTIQSIGDSKDYEERQMGNPTQNVNPSNFFTKEKGDTKELSKNKTEKTYGLKKKHFH